MITYSVGFLWFTDSFCFKFVLNDFSSVWRCIVQLESFTEFLFWTTILVLLWESLHGIKLIVPDAATPSLLFLPSNTYGLVWEGIGYLTFPHYLWYLLVNIKLLFLCSFLSCLFGRNSNLALFILVWWVDWVFQAANYLNIKGLLDLTCQTVADMIKGKTPEEIRKTFNIKNDFTPEEEEEVRRENQWAFEWSQGLSSQCWYYEWGDNRNVDIATSRSSFPSRGLS